MGLFPVADALARHDKIFLACASVDLLALMDQTTLAASLHIVANALGANSQAAWFASGYFITSTSFQLLYGRLSDIWSRKFVLLIGLAIFFVGSLASSLAQTATQLIAFRALTGVGGGGLMTVAQLIVSDVVPLRERGKYQGILVCHYITSTTMSTILLQRSHPNLLTKLLLYS